MTVLPAHILRTMSPADRKALGVIEGLLPEECHAIAEAKSEKVLQQQLEALLRRQGLHPIRQRMDRKSNVAIGTPDILFADHKGRACAWEVKMPGQKPTPEQLECHAAMTKSRWVVSVVRSYDEGAELLNTP